MYNGVFFFLVVVAIPIILKKRGEKFRYRSTATILSFYFGVLGFQKFYLGETKKGVYSILFSWTFIPTLIGLIDFVKLWVMNESKFDELYNWGRSPEPKLTKPTNNRKPKMSLEGGDYSYQPKLNYVDDTIIDISSEDLDLRIEDDMKIKESYKEPPYWRHTYIYSYSDIQETSKEQKEYYLYFKNKVINNTNLS
jgi:TM2 domain-containing membrane protein YozV